MTEYKLCARDFTGKPVKAFHVRPIAIEAPTAKVADPSHHVIIVDRSGSMYGSIEDVRSQVRKILTLDEFNKPELRVSLISYSSKGDVTTHFKRVPIQAVMASGSRELQEVDRLRATSMTCISQSLKVAETLVDDADVTAISLHTDGFANDTSPTQEYRDIDFAVSSLRKHPRVMVNTIAYGGWCDYNLLSRIANELSGSCVQAGAIRDVYKALYDTTKLLASGTVSALEVPCGTLQTVLYACPAEKKFLGSEGSTLMVRGVGASPSYAFVLTPMSVEEYLRSGIADATGEMSFLFARYLLSVGRVNDAKYVLISTRRKDLIESHYKALSVTDIKSLASDLELELDPSVGGKREFFKDFGVGTTGPSIDAIMGVVRAHAHSLEINIKALLGSYKRRGVKRVAGVRNADGSLKVPEFRTVIREKSDWIPVSGVEINRASPNINLRVVQDVDLVRTETSEVISRVAGINLKLQDFKNYTIVGDGSVSVPTLTFRTGSKATYEALHAIGAVEGTFRPGEPFTVDLLSRPLVDFGATFDLDRSIVEKIFENGVASKFFEAMLKEKSGDLTPEQIQELGTYNITKGLNFSPPTTTSYTSLEDAISKGEVDTRLSYKIDVGTTDILSLSSFYSGNDYLQRRYTAKTTSGQEIAKPKMPMFLDPSITFSEKVLSARTKLGNEDAIQMKALQGLMAARATLLMHSESEILTLMENTTESVDTLFRKHIIPLAFYIGASGLVPESLGATKMTYEEFSAKYPQTSVEKAARDEGTFYVLPNGVVVTVYTKAEHFSTTPILSDD
jgi:hypothetical protein